MRPVHLPEAPLEAQRILVRATNWIGDLVMISPAIEAIRRAWPEAHLALLVREPLAPAMAPNPHIDEILPYERSGRHAPPFGTLVLGRELKEHGFDLAVLFPKSFESALLARLAGIPHRVGWRTDGRGLLLTHGRRLTAADRRRHHVHQFLEVVRFAGCPLPTTPQVSFHIAEKDRRGARELLDPEAREAPFLLAIHPGASKGPRSWHRERFAKAADAILHRREGSVVLLGGPDDRADCAAIRAAIEAPAQSLAGRTTIGEMAALIERADLLLANDSGPMHLAAALGTPHVAVFGPGSPQRTAPLVGPELSRPVTLGLPCSPCRQKFFRECRPGPWGKPWCLEDLPVDTVARAALDLLEAPRG